MTLSLFLGLGKKKAKKLLTSQSMFPLPDLDAFWQVDLCLFQPPRERRWHLLACRRQPPV